MLGTWSSNVFNRHGLSSRGAWFCLIFIKLSNKKIMSFVEHGSAVMAKWLKQWNVTKLQLFTTNCDLFLVCCNNSISVLWGCMKKAVVVVRCCWKWIFLGLRRGDKLYRVWIWYRVQYLQRFCKFVLFVFDVNRSMMFVDCWNWTEKVSTVN